MKRLMLVALSVFCVPGQVYAQDDGINGEIDVLVERVQGLEAQRAIKKLQNAFGYYVDRGLWGEAADLFTAEGSIEIGMDGVYQGSDRIREYLKRLHGGQVI